MNDDRDNGNEQAPQIRTLPPPKTWDELSRSHYLHAEDLRRRQPDAKLFARKILEVGKEALPDPDDPKREQIMGTLKLEGEEKLLGLNTTNRLCMQAMFGNETAAAIGKTVVFRIDRIMAPEPGSKARVEKDAIRIAGSPDLSADVVFLLKLPRKKPVRTVLVRMQPKGAATKPSSTPAPTKPLASSSAREEPPPQEDPFA